MQTEASALPSLEEKSNRNWAMLCHLAALSGMIPLVPFGNILGPLVVWLWKRNEVPGVNEHGKAALNFHLSVLIYLLLGGFCLALPAILAAFVFPPFMLLLFPLLIFLGIAAAAIIVAELILTIVAALNASDGKHYQYPFTMKLIK